MSALVFASGNKALGRPRDCQPQLILRDVMIPALHGPATLKMLRGMPQFANSPVILMTATVQPNEATGYKDTSKEHDSADDRRAVEGRRENDVIDLAILGRLVRDDPDKVRKFSAKFLEAAREILAEMDAAHIGGNLAALGGLGHKLKSSARTVGATGFADLCQALESAGKDNDMPQAELLLRQLHPLLERIARQVEQETA